MGDQHTLAPLEAALLLGITPELLFAYVRYPCKKLLAPDQRLIAIQIDGRVMFRRSDLEAFDQFLHAPWAGQSDERPTIPSYILDYLKVECGSECARCGAGFPLKNAHINAYATTHSHHHHNLIRLCASCHDAFDAGVVPFEDILRIKQSLVAKVRRRIESRLHHQIPRTRTLPAPIENFAGREQEVLALHDALSKSRVVSVQGPGGSGKTELLIQTAYSSETGHRFRGKLDTQSTSNWTPIPWQTGHFGRSGAGSKLSGVPWRS